jgi:hypothetical protein
MNTDDEPTASSYTEENSVEAIVSRLDRLKIDENTSRSADHKAYERKNTCAYRNCNKNHSNAAALVRHIKSANHKVSAEKVKEDFKAAKAAFDADRSPFNTDVYVTAKTALARLKKLGKEARRRRRRPRTC